MLYERYLGTISDNDRLMSDVDRAKLVANKELQIKLTETVLALKTTKTALKGFNDLY